ncbi:RING-H2 finger containing membrane associated [Cryptosporidium sp. chipmunk genotype I]|uniref:RING-H2 finger containing membrane associated n=1 Tax=Cryptosporidium sp. chipmunk genotype I TaxID=1280935 RepID=UPI00351A631C|nr:RING-H2 finger containing membrane associated [Cryptosporidium sp. chipmunk genotype I]
MENNSSEPEANIFHTSIIGRLNNLEFSAPSFSAERSSRNLFFTFFLLFVIIILSFENKFQGNGSIVASSTVSSSAFYFGEFQMNTYLHNYNEKIHDKNGIYTSSGTIPTIFGNSRWQLDWTKSSISSKSAWVSLTIQLDKNGKHYNWNFEKFIVEDELNMVFNGKENEIPTNQIQNSNSTDCLLEVDASNDANLVNQIFPQRENEKYKFRGSNLNEKGGGKNQIEFVIKSLNCGFDVILKGAPFSMSLFRLNVIHFSLLYNLKVLMEIRGSVTQLLHSNSPAIGPNFAINTSISCLFMQIILDVLECAFILYCSFALPSLLFSSFSLMILFKWIHIFYIEIKYLFWIWKSNYLQNMSTNEIPVISSQFYRRLYVFLFGIVFFFILLFRISDSSQVFSILEKTQNKRNKINVQSIPYCIYVSLFLFLIPQILNDLFANTRNYNSVLPLHPHFILTSLIGKAFVPIYVWGYSNSIFNAPVFQYLNIIPISTKNSPLLSISIFLITSIQVIIYFFQLKFGPKCLIPKIFRPKPYNYFRLTGKDIYNGTQIEEDTMEVNISVESELNSEILNRPKVDFVKNDISNTQSSGLEEIELTSFNGNRTHTNRLCVICMMNVSIFKDFDHELCAVCTPCDHIFHQKCLKQWISVKPECPTCRREIPPFETK